MPAAQRTLLPLPRVQALLLLEASLNSARSRPVRALAMTPLKLDYVVSSKQPKDDLIK